MLTSYIVFLDTMPVEIAGRVQVLENGDLLIAAVKLNDAGKYTCIRANEAGSVNGSAYITVLGNFVNNYLKHYKAFKKSFIISFFCIIVRTQIIQPPVDTSVLLGHTAELQCKVSNDPSVLYDIAWFHNAQ